MSLMLLGLGAAFFRSAGFEYRRLSAPVIVLAFLHCSPSGAIVGGSPDQPRKNRWFVMPHLTKMMLSFAGKAVLQV